MLIRLKTMPDNREFAATLTPLIEGRWSWIQDCVAAQFDCDIDDIATLDTDDAMDLITVRGEVVARIESRTTALDGRLKQYQRGPHG